MLILLFVVGAAWWWVMTVLIETAALTAVVSAVVAWRLVVFSYSLARWIVLGERPAWWWRYLRWCVRQLAD